MSYEIFTSLHYSLCVMTLIERIMSGQAALPEVDLVTFLNRFGSGLHTDTTITTIPFGSVDWRKHKIIAMFEELQLTKREMKRIWDGGIGKPGTFMHHTRYDDVWWNRMSTVDFHTLVCITTGRAIDMSSAIWLVRAVITVFGVLDGRVETEDSSCHPSTEWCGMLVSNVSWRDYYTPCAICSVVLADRSLGKRRRADQLIEHILFKHA